MSVSGMLYAALVLALIVKAVVDYLKLPLINTPHIVKWLLTVHLAYEDGNGGVTIWIIPYVTFAFGFVLSMVFGLDLVSQYMIVRSHLASQILTGMVIGVGSNLIHQLASDKTLIVPESGSAMKRLL